MKTKLIVISMLLTIAAFHVYGQSKNLMPNTLYVKMKDDLNYTIKNKQLSAAKPDQKTAQLLTQLKEYGSWQRVHQASDEQLQQWRSTAEKNLKEKLPDPRTEFHFRLTNTKKIQDAIRIIQQLPDIEKVLRVPAPVRLPTAPDFSMMQTYKTADSNGINADSVYLVYNNRGIGIKVCDIEYGFNGMHTDFPTINVIGNTPVDPFNGGGIDHGTAVFGEIVSKNDGNGTTGIASDCNPYFAGAFVAQNNDTIYDLSASITNAMTVLGAGDVILLEQQIGGPNVDDIHPELQKGLVPVEWYKPYYDAIKLAIGQGITVVEAAANGDENLDAPVYNTGNNGHHPFLPGNGSGAIIVGAGGAGNYEISRGRLYFSNYGSCVALQGNGESVTTTGSGDLYSADGVNSFYTKEFGGTSSASPIVTGAVILLQSVYKSHNGGAVLTPAQVRDILVATGKPQTNGSFTAANYHIGPLPNVYAAIKQALTGTGINSIADKAVAMELYPNPTSGILYLSSKEMNKIKGKIQLYNSTGVMVKSFPANPYINDRLEIDIKDQPSGMYWLRLTDGQHQAVKKVTLMH